MILTKDPNMKKDCYSGTTESHSSKQKNEEKNMLTFQ